VTAVVWPPGHKPPWTATLRARAQRTWVTDLVEAALGCADSDAWELRWRWAWQQKRRLAIT
jgi:hypothetical protein